MRAIRLIGFAALIALAALAIVHCSDHTTPGDTIDLCELDTDCPEGMFCSSDLLRQVETF